MAMQILGTMPDTTQVSDLKSKTKARLVELLVRQVYADGEKPMSSHVAPEKKGKSKAVQRVAESRDQSG
jgi:hypothetical protein